MLQDKLLTAIEKYRAEVANPILMPLPDEESDRIVDRATKKLWRAAGTPAQTKAGALAALDLYMREFGGDDWDWLLESVRDYIEGQGVKS